MKRVLVIAAFAFASAAQAQTTKLGPLDIFNLEYASDPEISPDGQWIAYVREYFDVMTDRKYSNLWLIKSDGTDNRPLTTGKFNEGQPRWSPDGKRLAFVSNRDGSPQIYVRWMDNGQTSAITRVQEPPMGLSWSPDGTQLAFMKLVSEAPLTIGQLPPPPAGAQWKAALRAS
jgi:acylaminoacyl-peptidase